MSRKEGFCDSCQQNKDHRRVAGVFSLLNLVLLGIPSLFGISTWACVHCRSVRIFLFRQREVNRKIRPTSSHKSYLPSPPPNGGLKSNSPEKVQPARTRLYSEKYRDAVAKRIVSGITSIPEVMESLDLPDSEIVDWIKQSFQRKEKRLEMLRAALLHYQDHAPSFDVEEVMRDIEQSQGSKERPSVSRSSPVENDPVQTSSNRLDQYWESAIPNEG